MQWIEDSIKRGIALPEAEYLLSRTRTEKSGTGVSKLEGSKDNKRSLSGNSGEGPSNVVHPQPKKLRTNDTTSEEEQEEEEEELAGESEEGIEKALNVKQIIELDVGWISTGLP